jgi:Lamin Tail Domain/Thrombospondin type 3 repeat
MKMIWMRIARVAGVGLLSALLGGVIIGGQAEAAIVINEFRAATTAHGATDEFVELENSGAVGVQLREWDLIAKEKDCSSANTLVPASAGSTFPDDFFLGPGQKALLAPSGYLSGAGTADTTYEQADAIQADGSLALVNPEGKVVDAVGWDGGAAVGVGCREGDPTAHDLEPNQVLMRLRHGLDTDNNGVDFGLGPASGSPEGRAQSGGVLADGDDDLIADAVDNCPEDLNTDQLDTDGDGDGNACDEDDDGDGADDASDNCPVITNPGQIDTDEDGVGTACDPDAYNHIVGIVSPFAGMSGMPGTADGLAAEARFWNISGITAESNTLYLTVIKDNSGIDTNFDPPESWLRKVDLQTGQVTTLLTPTEMAAAAAGWADTRPNFALNDIALSNGVLYMSGIQCGASLSDCDPGVVLSYDIATGSLRPIPVSGPEVYPEGMFEGIETDGSSLFIAEGDCGGPSETAEQSKLLEVPLAGGAARRGWTGPEMPGAACGELGEIEHRAGMLYVLDRTTLYRVNPNTGSATVLTTGLDHPVGMEVTDGVIFVSGYDASGASGAPLLSIDRVTGNSFDGFAGDQAGLVGPKPEPITEGSEIGIGSEVTWFPGAVVEAGDGRLYVADRDASSSNAFARLMLREVEVLPDAFPPTGEASLESGEAAAAAGVGHSGTAGRRAVTAAGPPPYKVHLSAEDVGEGRIPSGVRSVQLRNPIEQTGWLDMAARVSVSFAPTEVRFQDRARNLSDWISVSTKGTEGWSPAPAEDESTPPPRPPANPEARVQKRTGKRAKALRKCRKAFKRKHNANAFKRCQKRARKRPV